jgi:hypothetical protein
MSVQTGQQLLQLGCVRRVVRTLGPLYVDHLTCFRVSTLSKHLEGGGNWDGVVVEACSCDREGWGDGMGSGGPHKVNETQ